jgi:hypothetical protein
VTFTSTSNTFTSNHTDGMAIFAQSSQLMNVTVTGGTYTTNGVGLDIETNGSGGMLFNVNGGTVNGCVTCGVPVNFYKGTGATGSGTNASAGTISGMTVTNGNSLAAPGIWVHGEGPGAARLAITNNNVSQVLHNGILVSFGNVSSGSQNVDVTVTGNTVNVNGNGALQGISVDAGTISSDVTSMCADVGSLTLAQRNTVSAIDTGNPTLADIRVRNRQVGTHFRLPGYGGTATDLTAVTAYLLSRNAATDASAARDSGLSNTGFTGGGACAAP